jgi:hypothetical protein
MKTHITKRIRNHLSISDIKIHSEDKITFSEKSNKGLYGIEVFFDKTHPKCDPVLCRAPDFKPLY